MLSHVSPDGDAPVKNLSLTEVAPSRSQELNIGYSPCFSPTTSFCFTLHKGPEEVEKLNHQNLSAWSSSVCHGHIVILQTKNKSNCV